MLWATVDIHTSPEHQLSVGNFSCPVRDSAREAAPAGGLVAEIEAWRALAIDPKGWVFRSEALTPMSKDNCMRRYMAPALRKAGLDWVNFQVMRRTHAILMKALGADGKLVADQLGHSLDVNQNIYTSSAVASRLPIVNRLKKRLAVQWCSSSAQVWNWVRMSLNQKGKRE